MIKQTDNSINKGIGNGTKDENIMEHYLRQSSTKHCETCISFAYISRKESIVKNYSHLSVENSDPVTTSMVSDIKDSYSSTSRFQHENFRKQNKYLGTSKK